MVRTVFCQESQVAVVPLVVCQAQATWNRDSVLRSLNTTAKKRDYDNDDGDYDPDYS